MYRRRSLHSHVPALARRVLFVTGLLPVVFVLLLSAVSAPAFAGRLQGKITPAPDVNDLRIVIRNVDTREAWTASPAPDGTFDVLDLPAGRVLIYAVIAGDAVPRALGAATIREPGPTQVSLTSIAAPRDAGAAAAVSFTLYKGEYYNNRTGEATADPVTVSGTATTGGINIGMSPGGATISGHVTVAGTGAPLANIVVVALGSLSSFDRTDASGNYTITGIPAGDFTLGVNTFVVPGDNDYVGQYLTLPTPLAEGENRTGVNFVLQPGGSISGTIYSGVVPGQGLPFAIVTAYSVADPAFFSTVLTLSDGTYRLRGLPAGQYTIRAEADNYLAEYFDNAPTSALATKVTVTAGQETSAINMTLAGGGVIQGVVRNQNTSEPLAGYVVSARNISDLSSRSGITDAAGTYTIEGLPTGDYAVGVEDLGRWYDNKTSIEAATPVHVNAGAVVSNINISGVPPTSATCAKLPSQVGRITGTVTQTANGQPLPNVTVTLYDQPTDIFPHDFVQSDASGNYAFECLDPGTYYVRARAPYARYIPLWYPADTPQPITVTAGGTHSGIDFALTLGGAISGQVTVEGTATGLEGVFITAKNRSTGEEFPDVTVTGGNYTIESNENGGLRPGTYIVWTYDYTTARLAYVPVELARFTASWTSAGVVLEWTPGDPAQYSGFHVYRSAEGAGAGGATPLRLTTDLLAGGPAFQFTDAAAVAGTMYQYWLGAVSRSGEETRFGPITAAPGAALATRLLGVSPNPVRSSAVVRFSLAEPGRVSIRIFDLSGRLVRKLADGVFPSGTAAVSWNARGENGADVPAGVYYLGLATPEKSESRPIVVAR